MKVILTVAEMREWRRITAVPVGFVPTMGYLHEGHISLVKRAQVENASVVVSIFVNPTQFGPQEDFKNYPRNTNRDLGMLEPFTDVVFMPSDSEMYPDKYNTWVDVKGLTEQLEGESRPGHFRGVSTVVTKLFNIVQPDKAYFGQKDAQQLLVIKKMSADLNMNLEVIACPTLREPDGLAMSSRNTYLTPEQRKAAPVLHKALMLARDKWSKGEKDAGKIRKEMEKLIRKEPLTDIAYVSIADAATLKEIPQLIGKSALVSMAVKIGKTRLIDNIILE
jgi:pantoate--beta-alanine ligase